MDTDSKLNQDELLQLEDMIDRRGIQDVLMAMSEICGLKVHHIESNWGDKGLARRWATMEGAVGCIVPKAEGL